MYMRCRHHMFSIYNDLWTGCVIQKKTFKKVLHIFMYCIAFIEINNRTFNHAITNSHCVACGFVHCMVVSFPFLPSVSNVHVLRD